ncbi:thioredoxin domain-containing protein [Gemelliphila palaticanis]|uniref:Thioredoxin n=1 Tax=Gemelliphila palaticanis TaxID=81950 RepID=A0ABX2SYQ2_9BACL|nr:thioredoxin domain-containing protein [Gemella palaticanis]MBF0715036.1 thioredoxin [Gemella palaticanis]NYS46966.1 thioredoxin [Gemella palaticanis]
MSFFDSISNFKLVNSSEVTEMINKKENFVLFIGRSSCPFCQRFAPKIGNVSKELENNYYFLNSEDFSDTGIASLREKYGVKTVPGLLVFNFENFRVVCDSSLSEEQIINFINK